MVQDDLALTRSLFPNNQTGVTTQVLRHPQFRSLGSDLLGGLWGLNVEQEQTPICGRSGMPWCDVNVPQLQYCCAKRDGEGAVEVNLRFQSVLGNRARYLWTPWEPRTGVKTPICGCVIIISRVCISDSLLTSYHDFILKFES